VRLDSVQAEHAVEINYVATITVNDQDENRLA
jgi:hypothetical protein